MTFWYDHFVDDTSWMTLREAVIGRSPSSAAPSSHEMCHPSQKVITQSV